MSSTTQTQWKKQRCRLKIRKSKNKISICISLKLMSISFPIFVANQMTIVNQLYMSQAVNCSSVSKRYQLQFRAQKHLMIHQ